MSLRNRLRRQLRNREFRHAYADEHLNLSICTQIKAIREKQRMSQAALAEKISTKQAGISRIESANYDGWSIALLRRLADAFDLRLRVSFEEFGTLWSEVENFNRESLERRDFSQDPEFEESTALSQAVGGYSNAPHVDKFWSHGNANDQLTFAGQTPRKLPASAAESAFSGEAMRA
jgi:transcriptional regulator with XRE-family HTH domain